jgi:molybdopterin-binding protein
MPRKEQGWITFQSSEEERQILEQICQQTQRTKTEVLREMLRSLGRSPSSPSMAVDAVDLTDEDEDNEEDEVSTTARPAPPQAVKISARNILKAKVKQIVKGTVNAEVILTIAPGIEIVSIVTRSSADKLGLKKGKSVFAVIKSNSVMIAEE